MVRFNSNPPIGMHRAINVMPISCLLGAHSSSPLKMSISARMSATNIKMLNTMTMQATMTGLIVLTKSQLPNGLIIFIPMKSVTGIKIAISTFLPMLFDKNEALPHATRMTPQASGNMQKA